MKAILLAKDNDQFSARVADVDEAQLPEGDVTIRVDYSTINYKDALAITNKSPIVRKWPMVAGIDAAGTVEKSAHADFTPGDKVILMGWGVGESHWGGLAQKARVKGDWLVKLPGGVTTREAMAIGSAGFTSMMYMMTHDDSGIRQKSGEMIVNGGT